MLAFAVVWIVLATAAVVLATQRKFASIDETSFVEVRSSEANPLPQHQAGAHRAGFIDQLGSVVTGVAVLYCLALLSGFLYIGWQNGQQILK
jgi:hypothetical protein